MADFKQAVEWMKEGKKVRRENWGKGNDIGFKLKKPQQIIPIILPDKELSSEGESMRLLLEDFEATNWEIYEEDIDINKAVICDSCWKKGQIQKDCQECGGSGVYSKEEDNWNLADAVHDMTRNNIVKRSARVDDIKTFIQKVKEDIKKIIPKYNREDYPDYPLIGKPKVDEIIDKRAGRI